MADPATQFQAPGLVSPYYTPVETRLPAPIALPYISPWQGVGEALSKFGEQVASIPRTVAANKRAAEMSHFWDNQRKLDEKLRITSESMPGGPDEFVVKGAVPASVAPATKAKVTTEPPVRTDEKTPEEKTPEEDQSQALNDEQVKQMLTYMQATDDAKSNDTNPYDHAVIDPKTGDVTWYRKDNKTTLPMSKKDAWQIYQDHFTKPPAQEEKSSSAEQPRQVQPAAYQANAPGPGDVGASAGGGVTGGDTGAAAGGAVGATNVPGPGDIADNQQQPQRYQVPSQFQSQSAQPTAAGTAASAAVPTAAGAAAPIVQHPVISAQTALAAAKHFDTDVKSAAYKFGPDGQTPGFWITHKNGNGSWVPASTLAGTGAGGGENINYVMHTASQMNQQNQADAAAAAGAPAAPTAGAAPAASTAAPTTTAPGMAAPGPSDVVQAASTQEDNLHPDLRPITDDDRANYQKGLQADNIRNAPGLDDIIKIQGNEAQNPTDMPTDRNGNKIIKVANSNDNGSDDGFSYTDLDGKRKTANLILKNGVGMFDYGVRQNGEYHISQWVKYPQEMKLVPLEPNDDATLTNLNNIWPHHHELTIQQLWDLRNHPDQIKKYLAMDQQKYVQGFIQGNDKDRAEGYRGALLDTSNILGTAYDIRRRDGGIQLYNNVSKGEQWYVQQIANGQTPTEADFYKPKSQGGAGFDPNDPNAKGIFARVQDMNTKINQFGATLVAYANATGKPPEQVLAAAGFHLQPLTTSQTNQGGGTVNFGGGAIPLSGNVTGSSSVGTTRSVAIPLFLDNLDGLKSLYKRVTGEYQNHLKGLDDKQVPINAPYTSDRKLLDKGKHIFQPGMDIKNIPWEDTEAGKRSLPQPSQTPWHQPTQEEVRERELRMLGIPQSEPGTPKAGATPKYFPNTPSAYNANQANGNQVADVSHLDEDAIRDHIARVPVGTHLILDGQRAVKDPSGRMVTV